MFLICKTGNVHEFLNVHGEDLTDWPANIVWCVKVNDCVLTMLHHVSGDLEAPHTLYIPSILKTFVALSEEGGALYEDWVDLIHFTIQTFLQRMVGGEVEADPPTEHQTQVEDRVTS